MSYRNATAGGDWIIQEKLANSAELDALLPDNAPLSTFRVITGSWGGLAVVGGAEEEAAAQKRNGGRRFDPAHPVSSQ
jgi:hypothetical protein